MENNNNNNNNVGKRKRIHFQYTQDLRSIIVQTVAQNFPIYFPAIKDKIRYLPHDLRHQILVSITKEKELNDNNIIAFLYDETYLDLGKAATLVTDKSLELCFHTCCDTLVEVNFLRCFKFSEQGLVSFFQRMKSLKIVNLSTCTNVTDQVLEVLHDLESLNLTRCTSITDNGLTKLISQCPELTELVLFNCSLLTDSSVSLLAEKTPHLESLNLSRLLKISHHSVNLILAKCKHIRKIILSKCKTVELAQVSNQLQVLDLTSVKSLRIESLIPTISSLKQIHTLYLSDTVGVSDQVILTIAENCPSIHRLYLSRQSAVTDQSLVPLANSCPLLEVLNLSRCSKITDQTILALSKNCKKLDTIYLSQCTNLTPPALQQLFSQCPLFETVEVNYVNIDDECIEILARTAQNLKWLDASHCPKLSRHAMSALSFAYRLNSLGLGETNIQDEDLQTLSFLADLHTLNLTKCRKLTGNCVQILLESLPSLSHLYISGMNFQNETFQLKTQMPRMEALFASGSVGLTDYFFSNLIQIMPCLQTLVLAGFFLQEADQECLPDILKQSNLNTKCTSLTSESLLLLPKFCPNLQTLDISETQVTPDFFPECAQLENLTVLICSLCESVNDESVIFILQKCRHLHQLCLSGVPLVSLKSISTLGDSYFANNFPVSISLTGTSLTLQQVKALRLQYPAIEFNFSASLPRSYYKNQNVKKEE